MNSASDDEFERFVFQRKKALQRIARHTRGEHTLADVINEAWVMAHDLPGPDDARLNLLDGACQEKLLSHLYQHLVRYTEQNIRRAIRLDHAPSGSGNEEDAHPLTCLLVSNDGRDALSDMLEQEAAAGLEADLDAHGSLAAAYVHLLRHFDNKMSAVADHLLISPSYAYRRCAQARRMASCLHHIPVLAPRPRFMPGPWRRYRLRRPPVQLALFDFDEALPLRFQDRTALAATPDADEHARSTAIAKSAHP